MSKQPLNRREFLRLSLVLAGSALAASCQEKLPAVTPTSEAKGTMTKSGLQLSGGNAEAWHHIKRLKGSLQDPAVCQSLWIDNGRERVQAVLEGQSFSAEVPILPGTNALKAVCQQAGGQEELSSEITITSRLQQGPTAVIITSLSTGRVILDAGASKPDEIDGQPIKEYFWSPRPGNPAMASLIRADQGKAEFSEEVKGPHLEMEFPPVDGEYYFSLRVIDQAGREDRAVTYFAVTDGQPRVPDYDRENPAWVENAIVYGVIPRLFGTPGAESIQYRLDYLAELGINALWLAPVNATIDYGYSVIDYFELRDNFGSREDFKAMVQAAHERGIRVLMDFVPNHTSNEHPYFKDTVEKGRDSHYWDYYDRDQAGNYTYYFDWTHLPNLNFKNPEVRRMMIEAFAYWVREFDVDGFRVYAAWGIRQRDPDFWPEWRRALKRIKPDLLLLAEAGARDPYYFDNGFDAAYDWTQNLGNWAWAQFWAETASDVSPEETISFLKQALTNQPEGYHPDALIFRFLNNNDTGTRFITTHGEDLTRVATALLLTLPGIPCIYTADEAGQWFRPYYDVTPVSFRERYRGLHDYHQRLIGLRKDIPSLHSRYWQLLDVEPASQVIGYLRHLEGNAEPVLVLLNLSEKPASAQLPLQTELRPLVETGRLFDLLSQEDVPLTGANPLIVSLEPLSARILTAKKA